MGKPDLSPLPPFKNSIYQIKTKKSRKLPGKRSFAELGIDD